LPLDGLLREAKEEIGISFEREDAVPVHTMYRTKHDETGDRADYFFVVNKWKGEPKNMEDHKCDHLDWFTLDAIPKNTMHHVSLALNHFKNGISYSEVPFTKQFINPSG
jgi:8-oxo-dGTP diphosphatase